MTVVPQPVPVIGDGVVIGYVRPGPPLVIETVSTEPVVITPVTANPGDPGIVIPGSGAAGPAGRGLESAIVRASDGHLIFTYSDGQVSDLGQISGVSISDRIYRQQFTVPSTTWTVTHDLNTDSPLVEIWDINDEQYYGDVTVTGANSLTVEFFLPTAGRVTVKG